MKPVRDLLLPGTLTLIHTAFTCLSGPHASEGMDPGAFMERPVRLFLTTSLKQKVGGKKVPAHSLKHKHKRQSEPDLLVLV